MKPLLRYAAILAGISLAATWIVKIRESEPQVVLVLFRGGLKVGLCDRAQSEKA